MVSSKGKNRRCAPARGHDGDGGEWGGGAERRVKVLPAVKVVRPKSSVHNADC